jgi:soluble lytic murein transglycosylase
MTRAAGPRAPRAYGIVAAALAGVCLAGEPAFTASGARSGYSASTMWWVPGQTSAAPAVRSALATAVSFLTDGKPLPALPILAKATSDRALGGYALLYLGRAQLALDRPVEAARLANDLVSTNPAGYLGDAALLLSADAAEAKDDWSGAVRALQRLVLSNPISPEKAYLRLGRAALHLGNSQLAYVSFAKVYYEFPLTPEGDDAGKEIVKLTGSKEPSSSEGFDLDLGRAEKLFAGKRYADARKAFDALRLRGDRAAIALRLAECDFYLKRSFVARDQLRAYLDRASTPQPEAEFFYLSSLRDTGSYPEYVTRARAFVEANVENPLAEEALNNLGTHYVLIDDDAKAAEVLGELFRRFPNGAHADRAAWRSGWWAYKTGDYATAARTFESAAASIKRADYRPSWLYWAARAHARLGERDLAVAGYGQVIADYRNSYYGRMAMRERDQLLALRPGASGSVARISQVVPPAGSSSGLPPSTLSTIRSLLSAGLYDDAVLELKKARIEWGTSPALEATLAYSLNRTGELRLGITTMRRAYPQFLSDGGESMPPEILAVIFPVAYWDSIQKWAAARKLDPFMMAALIAQESTFESDAHSDANAWGLMQVLPSTGRQYAKMLGISPFSTRRLTDAPTNIRIGMAYFSDLVKQFNGVVPALAAYNAGEQRAARWLSERQGLEQDEFIDDIPFPETQGYIRRILGQAEDYRRLYGELRLPPAVSKTQRRP